VATLLELIEQVRIAPEHRRGQDALHNEATHAVERVGMRFGYLTFLEEFRTNVY
jgi:hypothetical protein